MKILSKIIYWALVIFALIQFIPVDRSHKPVNRQQNFYDIMRTPPHIQQLLRTACYDCHSNETVYPDYAYVAPVSWSVKHHVNEGREHLNFSEWATFNADLKKNMLENASADLKQGRMPLPGYVAQHPRANLSAADIKLLADYFDGILRDKSY